MSDLTPEHENDLEQLRGALQCICDLNSLLQADRIDEAKDLAEFTTRAIIKAVTERSRETH